MVRRPTRLALVVLVVLVATGPSALVLADDDGATGADSGVAAAVGPLDATGDLADENPTDENLTDDGNPTEGETVESETVAGETTDATETVTGETLTNTTDSDLPTGETTIDGTTTDGTTTTETTTAETTTIETTTAETTINATDDATTDLDADGTGVTTEVTDADATTELESRVSDATNAVENATSVTDGTGLADGVETVDDAGAGVTDAKPEAVSLDPTTSSSPILDAEGVGDALLEDGDTDDAESDDGESDSSKSDDSDPATDRERRTENETTTAAGTGGAGADDAGMDDAGTADEKGDDSGPSPDRDRPGGPPSGAEAVAGVGALTAAALFPQLADGLTLVGNAGALSAASSAVVSSQPSNALQGDFDRVWRTATAFRYSRHDDSDPLAHETRATLYETVERSPGAYLSAVCERADVAVSTARHHLDVLEDEGLVTTAKVRGKRRYFPGHGDDVELAAALEDEEAAAVLRALVRLGDSHGGQLADELDRDPSTVSYHLSRLEDAGLVEREREGRAVVNRLATEVRAVLGGETEDDGDATDETPALAD